VYREGERRSAATESVTRFDESSAYAVLKNRHVTRSGDKRTSLTSLPSLVPPHFLCGALPKDYPPMKKLLLTALTAAAAGCAVNPQPQGTATPTESVGRLGQAETRSPGEPGELRNLPKLRQVAPGTLTGTGAGTGTGGTTGAGSWQPIVNQPNVSPFYAGIAMLLTDGTVMVQNVGTGNWYKLTPDNTGSYRNGTWTTLAAMPNGYAPLYFASAVLADGRVIVEGGEYQALQPAWTTQGAIYDPTNDTWTSVNPPSNWNTIGDAPATVLADGRFVLSNCCTTDQAVLNPSTLTWTAIGSGKADINNEEGLTLLPGGKVLTVDTNDFTNLTNSEIFSPATGVWTSAGSTVAQLEDNNAQGTGSWELGPAVLRPDGTVFATGATGHTAIYDSSCGHWTAGPDFPVIPNEGQLDVADGPAVLEPNGHVMVVASNGVFNSPAHVFEFDGKALTEIAGPPGAAFDSSYNVNLLLLPTGEVMYTDFSNDIEIYAPTGKASNRWAPRISEPCGLEGLQAGTTHQISGQLLNGMSQAVAYGDDAQAATNYPLVRITNRASGHVVYARTHDHSSMAVASQRWSHTFFDIPATAETGESNLVVVANGIASAPFTMYVTAPANAGNTAN
jgi:hypothetical protein